MSYKFPIVLYWSCFRGHPEHQAFLTITRSYLDAREAIYTPLSSAGKHRIWSRLIQTHLRALSTVRINRQHSEFV